MARSSTSVALKYLQPFDWPAMVRFLSARSIAQVEHAGESGYARIVQLESQTGWIQITPDQQAASVRITLPDSLHNALPEILARVSHFMDLSCNPAEVGQTLGPLAAANPGLRVPGAFEGFEIAVRAILGQQVSVAGARTLAGRFVAAFGSQVESPLEHLSRAFPSPDRIAELEAAELSRLGILPSRASTIIGLAQVLARGELTLKPGVDVPPTLDKLRSIRGIGEWTAQYIAMRALAWRDAFPHTDLGVMKAMNEKNPRKVLAAAEAWRPWRSYAVMHLWASLT